MKIKQRQKKKKYKTNAAITNKRVKITNQPNIETKEKPVVPAIITGEKSSQKLKSRSQCVHMMGVQ